MAVTMSLGGVSLGDNFPLFSRGFEIIRPSDQGPSFRKVKITLAGFLEKTSLASVMALYETLRAMVAKNKTTFSYADGSTTLYSSKSVWIGAYNEPEDQETAKCRVGDYSIEIYYFETNTDNSLLTVTFGAYTFAATPKFGRDIEIIRDGDLGPVQGSMATIELSGFLFDDAHSGLVTKMNALQAAMLAGPALLTYGNISQTVTPLAPVIEADVLSHYCYYTLTFKYALTEIIRLKRKMQIPRIHRNPTITEEPGCGRRVYEFGNLSPQLITYSIFIQAESIATCRSLLAEEVSTFIEPGWICEMPGGDEEWDESVPSVSYKALKLYDPPIVANIG